MKELWWVEPTSQLCNETICGWQLTVMTFSKWLNTKPETFSSSSDLKAQAQKSFSNFTNLIPENVQCCTEYYISVTHRPQSLERDTNTTLNLTISYKKYGRRTSLDLTDFSHMLPFTLSYLPWLTWPALGTFNHLQLLILWQFGTLNWDL